MIVNVIDESGFDSAMIGLSLSYEQEAGNMPAVANKLCFKSGGHNKFLESMVVWLDITAPRYWWQQFDTYRVGVTKQSGSTMHTIMKRDLTQDDFEKGVNSGILRYLNEMISLKDFDGVKRNLPESFKQRRVVCLNYMALQRMIAQRKTHRLREWQEFVGLVVEQVKYPSMLVEEPVATIINCGRLLCRKM